MPSLARDQVRRPTQRSSSAFGTARRATTASPERPTQLRPLEASALAMQRTAGNQAVAGLVAQRKKGPMPAAAVVGGSAFQAELRRQVAATPELGDKIPAPEKIQSVGQEAAETSEALRFAQGRPALAAFAEQTVSGRVSEPSGLGAGLQPISSTPARIGAYLKSGGSRAKAWLSNTFSMSPVTKAEIGNYAETGAKGAYAGATTGASVLGQAGNVSGGLAAIGQHVAAGVVAATPAVTAIAHIAPVVGIFLAPMTMCLNGFQAGKAWDRAARLEELIQTADGKARADGHPPEIVDAVRGAMEQKYEQASRKAKLAVASLLSLTGGLVLLTVALASNPVGWAIGATLAALGGAYGFYVSVRAIWRSQKKKNKGETRKKITAALVKGLHDGDALAVNAVRELGLNPEVVKAKGGDALLFARLTTG